MYGFYKSTRFLAVDAGVPVSSPSIFWVEEGESLHKSEGKRGTSLESRSDEAKKSPLLPYTPLEARGTSAGAKSKIGVSRFQ